MRVLHVITGLGVGGAEHQLRLLLRHLPDDCEVATLTNPGPVADAIRADGIPVHELGMRGNRDVSVVPRLVRLIRAGRFDLVHTHLYRACVHGRVAARLAGVRSVATEHSLGDGIIEGRPTTAAVRRLYLATERLGTTTIAVSGAVARRLRGWGVPDSRIQVIPNGIDAAEFRYDPALRGAVRARLGIPADARVVGAVGRLEPTKRFDHLIRAVRELPDVTLLLVGDGSVRGALADLAADAGVAGRVVFTGATPHAAALMCAFDVFAAPSDQETFGLAVLEALASGLPVLYVSCPPLEELPTTAAPAARQIPLDERAFVTALRYQLARAGARQPVPPAVTRYDSGRLAGAVARLYQRVSVPTVPVHRPAEGEAA
jgi:glycosyltransferase involved in cell wall biosynthesis